MPEHWNILVVDEDDAVGKAFEKGLGDKGFRVDVALTPGEALMLATLSRPDAVIMDVRATDSNGTRLFQKLLATDDSMVVILLGASEDEGRLRGALKAGAFDWARKPVDLAIIEPILRRAVVLGRDRAQQSVVVPLDPERRRSAPDASSPDTNEVRDCAVCRGAVRPSDTNAVVESGAIYHAACWLHGRSRAQQS